ncbi:MAG: Gfo/Idh/MocA family oxidoreductase [Planctomycetaceae bacterium]|jgi:predicted dehydrogenase|nr:Gfo/Idh/MocA family oxidoreductase [Planctomycetaceae bacterium]
MSQKSFSRRRFLKASTLFVAGTTGGQAFNHNTFAVENQNTNQNTNQKIKIGQLGVGHSHANKIEDLRFLSDFFEVIGIAEDDPKLRAAAQKQACYRGLTWMSSEELLALPELRAVAVETEEHSLISTALRCIRAGKHIHLDKPAGESLKDFKQLLDEAKMQNLTVQMGYMYRNNLAVQFCIKAVKEGLLGNIFDLDAAMSRPDDEPYRRILKGFKGGAPYTLICHLIDLMVTLLGEPEKIHSFPRCTRSDGLVDNCVTVFEYPRGRIATLRTGVTEVGAFQRRHLTVFGDQGTIVIQPLEVGGSSGVLRLALSEDRGGYKKGYQTVHLPAPKKRYEDQWREFAQILRGEITNPYSYEHDFIVQKCLLETCGLNQ